MTKKMFLLAMVVLAVIVAINVWVIMPMYDNGNKPVISFFSFTLPLIILLGVVIVFGIKREQKEKGDKGGIAKFF